MMIPAPCQWKNAFLSSLPNCAGVPSVNRPYISLDCPCPTNMFLAKLGDFSTKCRALTGVKFYPLRAKCPSFLPTLFSARCLADDIRLLTFSGQFNTYAQVVAPYLLGKGSKIASIVRITQSSFNVSMYGDCSTMNPSTNVSRYSLGIRAHNWRISMS